MRLTFLAVGKKHDPAIAAAIEDYTRRLQKYCKPQWVIVAPPKAQVSPQEQKRIETQALLAKLASSATVILLDEYGQTATTRQLAQQISELQHLHKEVIFVIGGAYGVTDDLKQRATRVVSLSKLTFPHQLVRLILAEQMYRVFTVLNNEPYHHD